MQRSIGCRNVWMKWTVGFLTAAVGLVSCGDRSVIENDESSDSLVRFVDVTREAGIQFRHVHGGTGKKYYVETMGSGAAFLDYDNDGNIDIYFVNSAPLPGFNLDELPTNVLYRNQGDGTFTDVTQAAGVGDSGYGMGVVAGDVDNDGHVDIYVTNFGANVLYHNNGNGTFTDVSSSAGVDNADWGTSAAFADYDNDGYLDLYVANYVSFDLEHNVWCGDRKRGLRSYCHPDAYFGVADVLYHNDGNTGPPSAVRFTDVTKVAGVHDASGKGLGVVWGDYDNDGDQDIYIANDSTPNFLYRNEGDGTFSLQTYFAGVGFSEDGEPEAGMGVDFGDYDNDGYFDVFVTNLDFETNTLYRNNGNGTFSDKTYDSGLGEGSLVYVGFGTNFFDYDNDGDQDLMIANGHILDDIHEYTDVVGYAETDRLYENQGDGNFADVSAQRGGYFARKLVGRGLALGDYDNDGDNDVLITNSNAGPVLLRNDGGNHNNWLIVKTIGTVSNRDGIGARIRVVTGDRSQIEEVRSGSSYLSQNDLRILFGLGDHRQVDSLEVRWPSGSVQRFIDIAANQLVTVKEGGGLSLPPKTSF